MPILSYVIAIAISSAVNYIFLQDINLNAWITILICFFAVAFYLLVFRHKLKPKSDKFAKFILIIFTSISSQLLGGINSYGMALYFIFLALTSLHYGTRISLELVVPIMAIESINSIIAGTRGAKFEELIIKTILLVTFVYLVSRFNLMERHPKKEFQEKLASLEAGVKALQSTERQFDMATLRESIEQKKMRISRALLALEESLSLVVNIAMETLQCNSCAIFTTEINNKEQILQLRAIRSKNSETIKQNLTIESGKGLLGLILKEKKPVFIAQMRGHTYETLPYYKTDLDIGSFFAFPIMSDIRLEGIICFDRVSEGELSKESYQIVSHLAKQTAISIAYTKSQERTEDKAHELFALYEASRALGSTLGVDSTLRTIVLIAKDIVNYDSCLVALLNEGEDFLLIYAASGYQEQFIQNKKFSSKEGLYGWVIQQKKSILYSGKTQDPQLLIDYRKEGLIGTAKSFLILPLILSEKIIGLIQLNSNNAGFFTEYDQEILGIFANQASIAIERARLYENTKEMASTDGLTGLFNYRYFQEQLSEKIQNYKHLDKPFTLIMCDIDHFKQLNDSYGHLAGNKILKQLALLLKEICPENSTIARYGGEEFIVILSDTDSKGAHNISEKIRKTIENRAEMQPKITASLGIASFPLDAQDQRTLIHYADMALYQAKEEGRNKTVIYQKSHIKESLKIH